MRGRTAARQATGHQPILARGTPVHIRIGVTRLLTLRIRDREEIAVSVAGTTRIQNSGLKINGLSAVVLPSIPRERPITIGIPAGASIVLTRTIYRSGYRKAKSLFGALSTMVSMLPEGTNRREIISGPVSRSGTKLMNDTTLELRSSATL